MSASTTKILMLLLFTGSLVSAAGRSKKKESKISGPNAVKLSKEEQANKYGYLNDTLKDKRPVKKGLEGFFKISQESDSKKAEQHLAVNKNKWVGFNKPRKEKRNDAATKIQTLFRGKLAQDRLKELKAEKKNNAATYIQKVHRGNKDRKQVKELKADKEEQEKKNNAATKIQTLFRGKLARNRLKELKADKEKKNNAATYIQKVHKGNKDRKQVKELKKNNAAATTIQNLVRARNQLKKLKNTKQNKKNLKKRKKRAAEDERQEKPLGKKNAATDSAQEKELKENRDNVQLKVDDRPVIQKNGWKGFFNSSLLAQKSDLKQAKLNVQASAAKYAAATEKRRQEKAAKKALEENNAATEIQTTADSIQK